ncbi:hypothetical protein [Streptomyces aureocirculatus]|uniref:hypothetical protein n=1 Tax=Streptomyces aureocirculatus TaxID=67275 RepID=UPI0012FEA6F3|nr:hypothetical protein [Streptomyces aureocirculatus]
MTGTVAPKRKRNLWVAVSVTLVSSVGVVVWQLWPASAPAVSVPDQVCGNTLPGNLAADLLPKSGSKYWEDIGEEFGVPYTGPTPDCTIAAGDRELSVTYFQYLDLKRVKTIDKAVERVEREAEEPGSAPLRLGEARGYASKRAAVLLLNCPTKGNPRIIEASVHDVDRSASAGSNTKAFAELTAETLRLAARDVYKCGGSPALPSGSPSLGRPRAE